MFLKKIICTFVTLLWVHFFPIAGCSKFILYIHIMQFFNGKTSAAVFESFRLLNFFINSLLCCMHFFAWIHVFHKLSRGMWLSMPFTAKGFGTWFCRLFIWKSISPTITLLLQAEKNELRDEKQRLKAEKESLEQQIKFLNSRPSLVPHPPVIPASAFAAPQGPAAAGHKLMMPVIGYPGFPMWQFMPPSDVDTSNDPKSCPPVA